MFREYVHVIYEKINYMLKIGMSHENFWFIIGIIAAIGLFFYVFLRTPKV